MWLPVVDPNAILSPRGHTPAVKCRHGLASSMASASRPPEARPNCGLGCWVRGMRVVWLYQAQPTGRQVSFRLPRLILRSTQPQGRSTGFLKRQSQGWLIETGPHPGPILSMYWLQAVCQVQELEEQKQRPCTGSVLIKVTHFS